MATSSPHEELRTTLSQAIVALERLLTQDRGLVEGTPAADLVVLRALVMSALLSVEAGGGLARWGSVCSAQSPWPRWVRASFTNGPCSDWPSWRPGFSPRSPSRSSLRPGRHR